ncbi:MAG TPA: ABC transporter permease, partial [Saprospiraceae bacterium]|nr:ABC transporter permease [Saprospiraceae bacterium]
IYKKYFPAYPFEFRFTRDEFQQQYQRLSQVGMLANVFGALAIFISCLGLFGLSAYTAEQRRKEVGIRKVLGATLGNIWLALSKDFLKPVVVAFALAAPLGAWAMSKFLLRFDYRIELGWMLFAAAGALALLIAVITVSVQGLRAALAEPVRSLQNE